MADPAPGKGIVLFDGECPLCQRSIAILRKLDWLSRLHFQSARLTEELPDSQVPLQPHRLLEEMHVLTPERDRTYAGFLAFRWIAWRLPLLMMMAPVLYVPGVPTIGQWIYLRIAKNRFQLVPCHNGVCQLPLKKSS